MFKKLSILLLYSASSLAAQATSDHNQSYFKSGFLIGAHGGYSFGHGKFDGKYERPPSGLIPGINNINNAKGQSSNWFGGILLGYLHTFNNSYTLGGEVVTNLYGNKTLGANVIHTFPTDQSIFSHRLKRDYAIIPSINFGKLFSKRYHIYFGLGASITRFEHECFNHDDNLTQKKNKTKVGFVPSLGFNFAFNQRIYLGINVNWEIFPKIENSFSGPSFHTDPLLTYKSKILPYYMNTRIGLTYKL